MKEKAVKRTIPFLLFSEAVFFIVMLIVCLIISQTWGENNNNLPSWNYWISDYGFLVLGGFVMLYGFIIRPVRRNLISRLYPNYYKHGACIFVESLFFLFIILLGLRMEKTIFLQVSAVYFLWKVVETYIDVIIYQQKLCR